MSEEESLTGCLLADSFVHSRSLCIDAIEKAHSLDPTNSSNAERLRYYKNCQEDEQESIEGSGENFDYDDGSSRLSSSSEPSVRHQHPAKGPTEGVEMIENIFDHGDTVVHRPFGDQEQDQTFAQDQRESGIKDKQDTSEMPLHSEVSRNDDSDATLADGEFALMHEERSRYGSPQGKPSTPERHDQTSSTNIAPEVEDSTSPPLSPRLTFLEYDDEEEEAEHGPVDNEVTLDAVSSKCYVSNKHNESPIRQSDTLPNSSVDQATVHGHASSPPEDPLCRVRQHQQDSVARAYMQSAPPHPNVARERSSSDAEPRAASAHAVSPPQQTQIPALDPQYVVHAFRQYHEALSGMNDRMISVEEDLRRQRQHQGAASQAHADQQQGRQEEFDWYRQQLQQGQAIQARHDAEMRALKETVDRMSAQLENMQSARSVAETSAHPGRDDGHSTRSPTPRSPRTIMRPSTSTSYSRSRPTSMVMEAEQRPRSVPPMHTGRSSATGQSDDPPPSFHSMNDGTYRRQAQHHQPNLLQEHGHAYFAPGETFDNFDKQAMLERGEQFPSCNGHKGDVLTVLLS